jgi:hypothetical protein
MGGFRPLLLAAVFTSAPVSEPTPLAPGCPGTIQWDAGGGSNAWSTPANWSTNLAPAGADDVCIPDLAAGVEVVHSSGTHAVQSLAGTGGLQVSGGTLSFSAASPGLGQLTVSGGTLSGTGDLPVDAAFAWTGGAMSGAGTTSVTGAVLSGAAVKDLGGARILETAGTTTWLGGQLRLSGGSSVRAEGLWDVRSNTSLTTSDGTGTVLVPAGATYQKSGSGLSTLAVPLTNAGLVSMLHGTLLMSGGSSTTGSIQASTGSTLEFSAGTHALLPGSSLSAGSLVVSGGSLTIEGPYSAASSGFTGGTTSFRPASTVSALGPLTITNTATVDFSSGEDIEVGAFSMTGGTLRGTDNLLFVSFQDGASWSGGEMTGPGRTWTNAPALLVWGTAPKDLTGGRRLSTWAVHWEGTGSIRVGSGATIHATGGWNLNTDASIVDLGGAGGFTYANPYGSFRKAGGIGTSVVGIPFTNWGIVQASTGTLQFTAGYTQHAGETVVDGGTLAATAPLAIHAGTLRGFGSVLAGVVSAGTVAPGLSAGLLSIGGAYMQTPSGTLAIEIGGLAPGAQHDRLDVAGAVSVAGALQVTLIGGFAPQDGSTFTILTSPEITGSFGTLGLPALPAGLGWSVHLDPTAIALQVSGDADADGVGDAGDCAPADPTAGYVPREVADVVFAADKQTLSWTSLAPLSGSGTVYDAVRGLITELPVGGASEACVLSGGAAPQVLDGGVPDPAGCFYYLVRARNVCGVGTYGTQEGGTPRSTPTCP